MDARAEEIEAHRIEVAKREAELGLLRTAAQSNRVEAEPAYVQPLPHAGADAETSETSEAPLAKLVDRMEDGPKASEPATSPQTQPKPAEGHEEESIDDYMSRLLTRLRGDQDGAQAFKQAVGRTQPQPQTPSNESSRPSQDSNPLAASATPTEVQSEPDNRPTDAPAANLEPLTLAPRAKAAEMNVDMTAMRELANLSAHTALTRHARSQLSVTMRGRIIFAIAALVIAAALLWLWRMPGAGMLAFYAALAGILLAASSGLRAVWLTFAKNRQIQSPRIHGGPKKKPTDAA